MNKIFYIVSFILVTSLCADSNISLSVCASSHAKMKIGLMLCSADPTLQALVPDVQKALEFTGQFAVDCTTLTTMLTKQEMADKWKAGYPYIIFLDGHKQGFEWRLYDTASASMIKGKRQHKNGAVMRGWAYALADAWWQELTGTAGFFSSKIAYCKEVPAGKHHYKQVFIADFDGSHEEQLVSSPTINVAPRWNTDVNRPLVFYSESTNANMRLMAVTMDKKRIMASNFDGLNMLPAFSKDGHTVVYCATRGKGNCQLYQWHHKELKRITNNEGNNICPCLSDDGSIIYFSSDWQTGQPQIYAYTIKTNEIERITQDGYCVSPSYCGQTNKLAYSKMVNGIMQLCVYDLKTKQHKQLTFDKANKEECAWALDGLHVICPVESGNQSRIAYFNTITKQYQYITNTKQRCSYPALSARYEVYPTVVV